MWMILVDKEDVMIAVLYILIVLNVKILKYL